MAKAKKQPKAPKKPKESAPLSSWENYEDKKKEWKKKCADIKSKAAKKKALIAKLKKA